MPRINKLNVAFEYKKIDTRYDFYLLTTSQKYINGGAKVLDINRESNAIESVVFDGGRKVYVMVGKGRLSIHDFATFVPDDLTLTRIRPELIADYILVRLFLYSLSNFDCDENKFNNISGKFFLTSYEWVKPKKGLMVALCIDVDSELNIICEASTFSKYDRFINKTKLGGYPKYEYSANNGCLRRVFDNTNGCYIKKPLFGEKAELQFLNIGEDKKNNKCFYIWKTIDMLSKKYQDILRVDYENIEIIKSITEVDNPKVMEKVFQNIANKKINLINWSNTPEHEILFEEIHNLLKYNLNNPISLSNKIIDSDYNLIFIHDRNYYLDHGYEDPYKKIKNKCVFQHITVEESANRLIKDNRAILETIIKELLIKEDVITGKITIDDWLSRGYKGDLIFGKEKNNCFYFIVVHPDGSIKFMQKNNDFIKTGDKIIDCCINVLLENKGKEKTIYADYDGNINVFSRTNIHVMPNSELYDLEFVSRGKESRDKLISGIVDINLFSLDKKVYFNAGIKGSGMQINIPKASLLYSVDVISGQNMIESLLKTLSVSFVKYKSFTVLPYPFKYLNEYISMIENDKQNMSYKG